MNSIDNSFEDSCLSFRPFSSLKILWRSVSNASMNYPIVPVIWIFILHSSSCQYGYAAESEPKSNSDGLSKWLSFEDQHPCGEMDRLVKLTETTVASCDFARIKVWDTRQRSCCSSLKLHPYSITDMTFSTDAMRLFGTCGVGTLFVCDLRRNVVESQSQCAGEKLLSVGIIKNGSKVVCGTEDEALLLYSWGLFEDFSDRAYGLSMKYVNALLVVDEDTIITGSAGGVISLVGILPNRVIRPVGLLWDPDFDLDRFPVSDIFRLSLSHDKRFIGCTTLRRNIVKIWDMNI